MRFIVQFLENVGSAAMLAAFMPARRLRFHASIDHLLMLFLATIGIAVAGGYAWTDPPREFSVYAIGPGALGYLLSVVAIALICRLQRSPGGFLDLAVRVLALSVFFWGPNLAYAQIVMRHGAAIGYIGIWAIYIAYMLWFLAPVFRTIRQVFGSGVLRSAALVVLYAVCIYLPITQFGEARYWYTAEAAEDPPVPRVNVERTYYAQRDLLDSAIAGLEPQRRGVTDLYFVGVAGDAGQNVFLREVRSVRELFDRRFDTAGRSLALINNRETVDTVPLANAPNLAAALRGVSRAMDPDEDVLFLFLTSHGSRSHRLTMEFWPLRLNDLPAPDLRAMIDRAGIKYRVIVVSACYSGGFIDALKDENSLILTAAARDRTSFGCSNENDFTYFGKAYFDEQLRRRFSFVDAFHEAVKSIAVRENASALTPSLPQIFVGEAIAPKLAEIERRLSGASAASRPEE